ncbi:hypothetical protein EW146_g9493 [Bondarzewia mesenterica]|uniref:Retrovirus-related Pol polyprotein from transposon TNT 1-94-like beta-barrel domain-containing protein n=1 Tax=Bondarzewia mesenterica TaxID=1095465 RepID=A0A4S4L5S7_9AGAM|nr:hypothetical protein EW146_g9493 [Bondarzewia mesenterica]
MTTTAISSDTLPSSIPKLDTHGENWAIFSIRFETAVKAKGKWDHFDGSNPEPVFPTLPVNSTVVRIRKFETVADQWAAIIAEYTLKAACRVDIDPKDYRSTIIASILDKLSDFASGLIASAHMVNPMAELDPDFIIRQISDKFERCKAKNPRVERNKCPQPPKAPKMGGDNRRGSARASGSANTVVNFDSESDSRWAVYCDSDSDADDADLPALLSSWMHESKATDDAGSTASFPVNGSTVFVDNVQSTLDADGPVDKVAVTTAGDENADLPHKELYDSRSTRHISPYRDHFEKYRDIPLKPFKAANKQMFNALSMGDIVVDVPNGLDPSKLRLTEVLYSPEVGYTLVSIGWLDELGYSTTFANGQCTITDPDGEKVGTVPRTQRGLYRVIHKDPSEPGYEANAAVESLSVMELHRRMGHISPGVAKWLVMNSFVTGIRLDTSSNEPIFCESCVYAKAKRRPIAKTREGDCVAVFGGEVHTDIWGPAPVAMICGCRYYVSFTDDKTRHTHLYLLRRKQASL